MGDVFSLVGKIAVEYSDALDKIDTVSKAADEAAESLETMSNAAGDSQSPVEGSGEAAEGASGKFSKWEMVLANLASGAIQRIIDKVGQLAQKIGELAVQAVGEYADYEQLVGGVETLFQGSAEELLGYAETAYRTAGMSANNYMETATSFAASLIQGLGGDTAEAVRLTDLAITDMSDNANKMGTDIASIQAAYQGFVSSALDAISSTISSIWNAIVGFLTPILDGVKSKFTTIFNAVQSVITSVFNGIKSTVTTIMNAVKTAITSAIESAKSTVTNLLNGIKDTFSSVFNGIKSFLSPVVDWLKGIFNFSWSLPKIKLPHFSISGSFSLSPPSVPHFSIDWYKKAMEDGMIMNQPTIFGFNPKSNQFMAGGEAGSETVVGTENLMEMIRTAVTSENGEMLNKLDRIISLLVKFFPDVLFALSHMEITFDDGTVAARLAPKMDKELGRIWYRKDRGR